MKAAQFPLAASLTIFPVALLLILINLAISLGHYTSSATNDSVLHYMLYVIQIDLLIVATTSLVYAQWIGQRRPLADFRWPTLLALAAIYLLLSYAQTALWGVVLPRLLPWLDVQLQGLETDQQLVMRNVMLMLMSDVNAVLPVVLAISVAWLWLRRPGQALAAPGDFRRRAVVIFCLFAWNWAILAMQVINNFSSALSMAVHKDLVMVALPVGCVGLALPVMLGALCLPRPLPRVRLGRLLLASLLAATLCALAMLAVTFLMVRAGVLVYGDFDFSPGLGFVALVGLVWFLLCLPLARIVVKLLFRGVPPATVAAA